MKDKRKKEPEPKKESSHAILEITGLIESPRWKSIGCTCSQDERDITHRYPIQTCLNCKFTLCENSIPSKPFIVNKGTTTEKLITKIKIVRGKKYEDVIGWEF
tara:strand:+ start:432 stop:740 length:309 start_codon:yes stop_codon:yes gene_type:complete